MNQQKGKARPKTSTIKQLLAQIVAAKGRPSKPTPKPKPKRPTAGLLREVGGTVGGFFGGKPGSLLGRKAGSWLGEITGLGAYKVNRNTLLTNSVPQFIQRGGGAIEISHREFIADISSTNAFSLQNYFINPGLSTTFPFLSQIALNFEQYEMLGLIFEFKTTSATAVASSNTALGVIVLTTNYDVLDANFTTKQQMEAYEYTVSTVPCSSVIHPVECDPRRNVLSSLYVRNSSLPSTADQRFYDLGNLQIASVGSQATATVGELWVSYHVRLSKPKLNPYTGGTTFAHARESPNATATNGAPLGTTPSVQYNSVPGLSFPTNSTILVSTPGTYMLHMVSIGNTTAPLTLSYGTGISSSPNNIQDGTQNHNVNLSSGNGTNYIAYFTISAFGTGAANTITIGGLSSGSVNTTDVWVYPIPSGTF